MFRIMGTSPEGVSVASFIGSRTEINFSNIDRWFFAKNRIPSGSSAVGAEHPPIEIADEKLNPSSALYFKKLRRFMLAITGSMTDVTDVENCFDALCDKAILLYFMKCQITFFLSSNDKDSV